MAVPCKLVLWKCGILVSKQVLDILSEDFKFLLSFSIFCWSKVNLSLTSSLIPRCFVASFCAYRRFGTTCPSLLEGSSRTMPRTLGYAVVDGMVWEVIGSQKMWQ